MFPFTIVSVRNRRVDQGIEQATVRTDMARLKWRCRRGMRELDFLLGRYLEHRYLKAGPEEQAGFRQFLKLPDPVILSWITGKESPPEGVFSEIVGQLLQQPAT